MRRTIVSFSVLSVAVTFALAPSSKSEQTGDPETITVQDPRPLAAAVREFQTRYGWIVTYEDPKYRAEDVVDWTDKVRNPAARTATMHRILAPRLGSLNVTFDKPGRDSRPSEIAAILQMVVDSAHNAGQVGEFRLAASGRIFHVIPTSAILNANVSLAPQKGRNAFDAVIAVLGSVSEATGQQVVIGSVPANLLRQALMEDGSAGSSARDVLLATLATTGKPLSWRLLYSFDLNKYALNIHIVDSVK